MLAAAILALAAGGCCAGFEGQWKTDFGTLTLSVDGARVTGTYTHDSGRIEGILSDNGKTLTGTWSEAPSYTAPADSGRVVLTLAPDGNSFTGSYWYGQDKRGGSWNGARINRMSQSLWQGKWQTNWGVMTITVSGDRATGTYVHDSGKISGTISKDGKTLEGTWSEAPSYNAPSDAGRAVLTLSADGNSFSGTYWYGKDGAGGSWSGKRIAQPVAPPVVQPSVSPWQGKWRTDWGVMTFAVDGQNVKGQYEHDNGRIEGTLSADGKTITGAWGEAPSYKPPSDGGKAVFTLGADGKSFTGQWWYGTTGSPGNWKGAKVN
jgi:predicted nucleic acid-binding Zn ribbon protein